MKSEFSIHQSRIDTLAYDKKNNSFVIIEFKRNTNNDMLGQGMSYLKLLKANHAELVLAYTEQKASKQLKRSDVNWTKLKVIFIAPKFSDYQISAIDQEAIELWQINRYSENIICFQQISASRTVNSIKPIQDLENSIIPQSPKEIKVYDEEYHLINKSEFIIELYQRIKEYIINFGSEITIKPTQLYIAFIVKSNFCDIAVQKTGLKIWLNMKYSRLNDPLRLFRDVSKIGHYGNGNCEIRVETEENIEYIVGLIKQCYNLCRNYGK